MTGKRPMDIPLLKSDGYRQVYLKDAPAKAIAKTEDRSLGHYGIHHRCIWNDVVPAHRLDFYMVFLVMRGEATHRFGLQEYALQQNMLCFVGPDMVNSWEMTSGDQGGYICTFSDDFFHAGLADQQVLSRLSFFQLEGLPVIQLSETQAAEYVEIFQLMEKEYGKSVHPPSLETSFGGRSGPPTFAKATAGTPSFAKATAGAQSTVDSKMQNAYSHEVLRGYLHALIGKAKRDHGDATIADAAGRADIRLLRKFTEMFNRDFDAIRAGQPLTIRKVSEYAELLGVSQNHLNDTIQALTGISAGQHIRNRLIRQATMCLKHSDKTVSEIAYRLGYEDPSYFARFYKNQTGKSPSAFRKK